MEIQLTLLILIPLGLAAAAVVRFGILPAWRRTVDRCAVADADEAASKRQIEEAERELHGDANP